MTNGASIWSGANKAGLVLLAIAAAVNLIPMPPPEGAGGPPTPVLIASAVLGLVALIAVVVAWSKNSRKAALVAVGVSILNALLAVPAFFEPGIPTSWRTLAGVFIAWTVVAVALTLKPNVND
jgi:hypothetical protein